MNIFDIFHARIASILDGMTADGRLPELDLSRFVVEPPKDAALGDLASNAAMVFAKEAKAHFANPRELATEICYRAGAVRGRRDGGSRRAGLHQYPPQAGRSMPRCCASSLSDPENFGRVEKGRAGALQGKVNVEYVSANPTGPMHVGHGRGAVFGDALANLLAFSGCEVTREYYINDAGAQVDVLARSAFLRYREALGETITIPEGLYPGDYLKPVGAALAEKHGRALLDQPESEWLPVVKVAAIDAMMDMIRDDLAALNIRHEMFFSERTLHDRSAWAFEDRRRH